MPAFELSVLFKTLPRPDLSAAIKRVGKLLLDKQTVLQKIENHGARNLEYRIRQEEHAFYKGCFFVYYFISAKSPFIDIKEECSRDVDILRFGIVHQQEEFNQECTLDEELQVPAYRKSVQKLLEKGKEHKEKTKIRYRHLREFEYFDQYM